MPVLNIGRNLHHIAGNQTPGGLAAFLVEADSTNHNQHLPASVFMPVIAATRFKRDIGNRNLQTFVLGQLNGLLNELREISDCPHAVEKFDIAANGKIGSLLDHLIQTHGPIDAFIHAPGITSPCPFAEVNPQLLERLFRINVISAFEFVRCLAMHPKRPAKAVGIFIAPITASDSAQGMSAYAMCRGAIISSMRVMAGELAEACIRLNYLIPGLLCSEGHITRSTGQNNSLRESMDIADRVQRISDDTVTLLTDLRYETISGEIVMFGEDRTPKVMSLEAIPFQACQPDFQAESAE